MDSFYLRNTGKQFCYLSLSHVANNKKIHIAFRSCLSLGDGTKNERQVNSIVLKRILEDMCNADGFEYKIPQVYE